MRGGGGPFATSEGPRQEEKDAEPDASGVKRETPSSSPHRRGSAETERR